MRLFGEFVSGKVVAFALSHGRRGVSVGCQIVEFCDSIMRALWHILLLVDTVATRPHFAGGGNFRSRFANERWVVSQFGISSSHDWGHTKLSKSPAPTRRSSGRQLCTSRRLRRCAPDSSVLTSFRISLAYADSSKLTSHCRFSFAFNLAAT